MYFCVYFMCITVLPFCHNKGIIIGSSWCSRRMDVARLNRSRRLTGFSRAVF